MAPPATTAMAIAAPPAPLHPSSKKRRTLRDAEQELAESRRALAEAKRKLVETARENAKMKVLLMKYIEKDDSLLSSSQLSLSQSSQPCSQPVVMPPTSTVVSATAVASPLSTSFSPKESSTTADEGAESEDSMWNDRRDEMEDEDGPGLSQMSQLSHVSQWSELSSTSNLDEIINFLEKQDSNEQERVSTLETDYLELKNAKTCVRVGVGVILTSESHPHCVLVGRRKGSHGEGKLALPGGHLEMYESWEECAVREVKEETEIDLTRDQVQFAFVTNDPMEDEGKHYITLFVHAVVPFGSKPRNMEPHKCEGWQWITWDELRLQDRLFIPLYHLTRSSYRPPNALQM